MIDRIRHLQLVSGLMYVCYVLMLLQ